MHPFVESTHFILLARNQPHKSSMFMCSCSKAGCCHVSVLLHGTGESAALHALHGWDFRKKLLWCIISTLLNSSDTSFHKSLLGCQVRLTWRSCNSIAATRVVRRAATGIVLLHCQPKHEWSEFHSCSISGLYTVTCSWRKVILRQLSVLFYCRGLIRIHLVHDYETAKQALVGRHSRSNLWITSWITS